MRQLGTYENISSSTNKVNKNRSLNKQIKKLKKSTNLHKNIIV